MSNYAIINNKTNVIDNVIVWDGISTYTPPDGYTIVEIPPQNENSPTPGVGWQYIDGTFVDTHATE